MVDDEQTHTLPEDREGLAVVARMAGYRTVAAFDEGAARDPRRRFATTMPSSSRRRRRSPRPSAASSSPATPTIPIRSRRFRGSATPHAAEVTRAVRDWHFGRYPAMRSAAARERLTEITPALLEALAETDNADAAFAAFDRFLARLPAGAQLFALLGSNPRPADADRHDHGSGAETCRDHRCARPCPRRLDRAGLLRTRCPDRKALEKRLSATLGEARVL